jgi:hypothetical protein
MKSYSRGMQEITAPPELTDRIIKNVLREQRQPDRAGFRRLGRFGFRIVCAGSLALVSLLILFLLNRESPAGTGKLQAWKDIFAVTVYAADGAPQQVKPEIAFPIGNYRVTNSRAPGFPIMITAEGADEIKLITTQGSFLRWNPPDYKVYPLGSEADLEPGETIYWTAMLEDNLQSAASESELTLLAYRNHTIISKSLILIREDNQGVFTGEWVEAE